MIDIPEFDALCRTAHLAANAGGEAALSHFRAAGLATDDKGGAAGFDPVTAADREAEAAIRAVLIGARPDDGIMGEEQARRPGSSGLTWVIDPIDGTRAFISGLPTWGVLIGLDDGDRGRIGIVDQPFTGERFAGCLGPDAPRASLIHRGTERPIGVRPCRGLDGAILFTTAPQIFSAEEAARFARLAARARLTRFGIDCYAYALLAMGQIDLVVEAGLAAYDIAAPAVLIRAAGGIVTDWQGGDPRWGGQVVAAGDPRTHEAALEVLNAPA